MPVNCASWSTTTTLSSASAVNVRCWVCPGPRSTTDPYRCGSRRCGLWPGSMPSTWRIPAAAVVEWWPTWPEMGFRSAVPVCETSCAAWVYGRSTRNRVPRFQEIPRSGFRAWWMSAWSRLWMRCGLPISPSIPQQKGFLYLVAIVDLFSRNVLSWRLSNSLDTEFCLDAMEMAPEGGRRPEIFHSDQGCQFTSASFVARLQAEAIKISCQAESDATTTSSLNGCGAQSCMRRFTCTPSAMAGRLRSAWPVFCGGTAM